MQAAQKQNISEFFKLDPTDKKTLFWLMDNNPDEIQPWIMHVAERYSKPEKDSIDPEKLYEEIRIELA